MFLQRAQKWKSGFQWKKGHQWKKYLSEGKNSSDPDQWWSHKWVEVCRLDQILPMRVLHILREPFMSIQCNCMKDMYEQWLLIMYAQNWVQHILSPCSSPDDFTGDSHMSDLGYLTKRTHDIHSVELELNTINVIQRCVRYKLQKTENQSKQISS